MTRHYDAIVIGAGQAGPPMAGRLAATGKSVAIIERKLFGGTCVNVGCIPSKALVASARAAWVARHAADFGVTVGGSVGVDMKKVKARKDGIVLKYRKGLEEWLGHTEHVTVYHGQAVFEGPHQVRVNDLSLTADWIFIDVGGRAVIPAIPGLDGVPYLTNSSLLEVDFLPEHLIILGGGYVGLEFGQMYRRFGSRVTIIQRGPRLIPREDADVSQGMRAILEKEDVTLLTDTTTTRIEERDGKIVVHLGSKSVEGSHLLVATGRLPNTADLGLDRAGIAIDKQGYIQVDDELRTGADGVWALGDCNGRGAFTHTSYNDFEIVAANLLDNDPRRVSDRITAYNVYTDPPLGRCGMTEDEVRKSGTKALMATYPMEKVKRAVLKGDPQGFMKILVDADTKRILGAAILGVEGDEAIHSILDVMYAKAPYTVIRRAVHIHPTVSELIPTMLGHLEPL